MGLVVFGVKWLASQTGWSKGHWDKVWVGDWSMDIPFSWPVSIMEHQRCSFSLLVLAYIFTQTS
jgi:hypothetical protein